MKKARFKNYNDGVLYICESASRPSSFAASTNVKTRADVKKLVKLDFAELSKRDEDLVFAESRGRTLTMKVRCRFHESASPELRVLIGGTLYSILKADHDADRQNMFLYLEEERRL